MVSGSPDKGMRVGWLMPSMARASYWQPVLRELSKIFPNTAVFTGLWPGYIPNCDGAFRVIEVGGVLTLRRRTAAGDDRRFIWISWKLIWETLRFRPGLVFVSGFSIWTLFAVFLKLTRSCRVVLLWSGVAPSIAYLNAPLRLAWRRLMARFLDAAVSNTEEGAIYLREVIGIPSPKIVHDPRSVPETEALCSRIDERAARGTVPRPVYLFVGQIIARKGVESLLQACILMLEKAVGPFSVVVIGDGPDAERLRSKYSEKLKDAVHWLGPVDYGALGSHYQACDVFVFPTMEDILGMVALEAMAFGKPVLCSCHAGAKERVRHGETGFIFDPRDPQELADYMSRFMLEPGLSGKMGAKARQDLAPFTPGRAAKVLADVARRVSTTTRAG